MSGIVGIVNLNGEPIDQELLSQMTEFMSFRGPDAHHVWMDRSVGFGHALLRTTDETEAKTQPATVDGNLWITADARLDGRKELIRKLEAKLCRSLVREQPASDAELILFAYEVWREECVKHLIGDFAFAIWDRRSQSLFCARDHFGVKPFFFAHIRDRFTFSNTLNALHFDDWVSDALNEIAIGDYLLFGHNQDLSSTTFRDIHRLPPGHTLTISKGSQEIRRYWQPEVTNEIRFSTNDSYIERFVELLSTAIGDRLTTNRAGVLMSGGLDSTSIAAIAKEQLGSEYLHAFSVVYDMLIPDQERRYSTAAADHLDIAITHISADRFSLFEQVSPDDMDQAEPFLLSPLTAQFNESMRHCAAWSRVALTGWDGDALMNENPAAYFTAAAAKFRLGTLATGLSWYIRSQKQLPPLGIRRRLKRVFGKTSTGNSLPEWIDESFAERTNLHERLCDYLVVRVKDSEMRSLALRALNSRVWGPLFEGYDPGATKLPLELRHPLIDLRLVQFLLAMPVVPWCVRKHILRAAVKDKLPTAVVNRPKTALAGDPALQLVRHASVRWLDSFEVSPLIKSFVNLNRRRSVANEETPDSLWASLRVFALNYWLTNSQPSDRFASRKRVKKIEPVTETSIA